MVHFRKGDFDVVETFLACKGSRACVSLRGTLLSLKMCSQLLGTAVYIISQSSIVSSVVDPFHFDTDLDPDPRIRFR